MFNPDEIKKHFPIFNRQINGQPLVYLDSAATAQKPQVVIDALVDYYTNHNANVHRGVHTLSDESTHMYEQARDTVAGFFGTTAKQLIFVKNTTEAINLIGYSWALNKLQPDDVILVSQLEHHSNLLVWQEVAHQTGAKLIIAKVTADGQVDIKDLERYLTQLKERIKLVSLSQLSNVTGAILDVDTVKSLIDKYAPEAKLVLDCAQSAPQMPIDFAAMNVDALAFSGHKLYGPMGVGGLIVRSEWLKQFRPFMLGGGMIKVVDWQTASYVDAPERFDAGTPNVADAVGLARACEFLQELDVEDVEKHSRSLVEYALNHLSSLSDLHLIGPADSTQRLGSVAFICRGINGHDVAQILDARGIAVRSGHHCTQPLHLQFGWGASVRASFGVYTTQDDIDRLVEGIKQVKAIIKT